MRVGPFKLDETRLLVARGYAIECTLHLFRGPGARPSLTRYEEDPEMRQEVAELIASAAVLQLEPAIVSMPEYNLHCKREPIDTGTEGPEGVFQRVYRNGVEVPPCPWRYTFVIEALDSSDESTTSQVATRKPMKRTYSASTRRSFDNSSGNSASVVRRSSTLWTLSGTSSAFSSTSRFTTPSTTPQRRSRSAIKRRATERPTHTRIPARSTKTGRTVIPSDDSFFTTDDDDMGARDTFGPTGGKFGSSVRFRI